MQVGSSSWITQSNWHNVSPIILSIVAYLKFHMFFSSFRQFYHSVILQGKGSTIFNFLIWGRGHEPKKNIVRRKPNRAEGFENPRKIHYFFSYVSQFTKNKEKKKMLAGSVTNFKATNHV